MQNNVRAFQTRGLVFLDRDHSVCIRPSHTHISIADETLSQLPVFSMPDPRRMSLFALYDGRCFCKGNGFCPIEYSFESAIVTLCHRYQPPAGASTSSCRILPPPTVHGRKLSQHRMYLVTCSSCPLKNCQSISSTA